MALIESLDLRQAAAKVFVDDANPRLRLAQCFAGEQYAKNEAGLYVPYSDSEKGMSKNLQVRTAAGNFQLEGISKVHNDNGFNVALARETPGVERLDPKGWSDLQIDPKPYQRVSRNGKEAGYVGYDIGFSAEGGDLNHRFESNTGWGKGDYTWTSRHAMAETFRIRIRVDLLVRAGDPYFSRQVSIDGEKLVDHGRAYATWTMPNGKPITLDFHDMVQSGQFDAKESVFDETGATLYSLPFTLKPGESYTVDPTITPDAGSSGAGAAADSAWGIDGTAGNTTAVGVVGGVHFLNNYNRFNLSPIVSGDTIDSGAYEPYVGDVGLFGSSTADYGPYNGSGQGDPASDAYATAYGRSAIITLGESYAGVSTSYQSTGRKSFTLGSPAISDLQSAIAGGFFSICNQGNGVSGNQYVFLTAHNNSTSANRPRLSIVYTEGGGGGSAIAAIMTNYRRRRQS